MSQRLLYSSITTSNGNDGGPSATSNGSAAANERLSRRPLSGFQSVQPRSRIGLSPDGAATITNALNASTERSFSMKSSQFFAPDESNPSG